MLQEESGFLDTLEGIFGKCLTHEILLTIPEYTILEASKDPALEAGPTRYQDLSTVTCSAAFMWEILYVDNRMYRSCLRARRIN